MSKQLDEYTKDELIGIIQDYQEMVSGIESILNKINLEKVPPTIFSVKHEIQDIIYGKEFFGIS